VIFGVLRSCTGVNGGVRAWLQSERNEAPEVSSNRWACRGGTREKWGVRLSPRPRGEKKEGGPRGRERRSATWADTARMWQLRAAPTAVHTSRARLERAANRGRRREHDAAWTRLTGGAGAHRWPSVSGGVQEGERKMGQ
jgi:hypothetical protein